MLAMANYLPYFSLITAVIITDYVVIFEDVVSCEFSTAVPCRLLSI